MVHAVGFPHLAVLALLSAQSVYGHGGEAEHGDMLGHHSMPSTVAAPLANSTASYFTYPEHGKLILAHIALMTVAWFFVLPIGEPCAACKQP